MGRGGLCWGLAVPPPALQLGCLGSSRALQHGNLLQCLAQCAEVTPYLLVMEFCPLVSGSPWEAALALQVLC